MNAPAMTARRWPRWIVPAAGVLLAVAVACVGISDPAYLSKGDPARYLMNAVFFHDIVRDAPIALRAPMVYAEQYYARYPALTLGHHPLLPSLMMVPLLAVGGLSIATARIVPLVAFVAAGLYLFALVDGIYGRRVAGAAMIAFVLSPSGAWYSRVWMSEMPAIAALIATTFYCDRYVRLRRSRDAWVWAAWVIVSLAAKQLTAFMLPVYLLHIAYAHGWRALISRPAVGPIVVAALASAVTVALTAIFAPSNVRWVLISAAVPIHQTHFGRLYETMVSQVSAAIVVLAAAGAIVGVVRRDKRTVLFLAWIAIYVLVLFVLVKRNSPDRFTIYWTPALCVLAATTLTAFASRGARAAVTIVFVAAIVWEAVETSSVTIRGAGGYEEAARYVVQQSRGPTLVLFSGDDVDVGYFTFFIRRYDAHRDVVVLRANKILTTSYVNKVAFRDKIDAPEQIDGVFRDLGIRFVVLEDRASVSKVLNWLRERLDRPPFAKRLDVSLGSRSKILEHVDLKVFENLETPVPNRDAAVTLDLPIVGRTIAMRVGDILAGPGLAR